MITSHPNTTMARKGQTKELNCTARGEQPIIIRWERGDTVIDAERNPRYSITINKKGDEVISTLKVRIQKLGSTLKLLQQTGGGLFETVQKLDLQYIKIKSVYSSWTFPLLAMIQTHNSVYFNYLNLVSNWACTICLGSFRDAGRNIFCPPLCVRGRQG